MARPFPTLAACFAAVFLATVGEAVGQIVGGVVVESGVEAPVSGVQLTLFDVAGAIVGRTESDDLGRFALRAPSGGVFAIAATRIGYVAFRSDPMVVPENELLEVRLQLGVNAVPLDPLVVVADEQLRRGRAVDFERRRLDPSLGGHFIDRDEIQGRPMATPSGLVTAVPAVSVYQIQTADNPVGLDRSLIYLPGGRGGSIRPGSCLAQVYINGVPYRQSEDRMVSVDDVLTGVPILGVEVYTRAAAAPIEYVGTGECGVVLYWTEEPESSSGSWGLKRIGLGAVTIAGVILFGLVG